MLPWASDEPCVNPDTVFCAEPYVLEQQIVSAGQVDVRPNGALGCVVAVEQQVLLPVAKADKRKGDGSNVKVYVVKEHEWNGVLLLCVVLICIPCCVLCC